MKKIIFTSLIAIISLSTFAQGNSQKNKNKSQSSASKKEKEKDDDKDENRDRRNNDGRYDDRNDRYEDRANRDKRNNDGRYENRDDKTSKYSKNTPRKVEEAFRTDFPNANNVTWTKNSGTWTANFGGGGILGNTRSATYRANGQRVSTNGILGRRN